MPHKIYNRSLRTGSRLGLARASRVRCRASRTSRERNPQFRAKWLASLTDFVFLLLPPPPPPHTPLLGACTQAITVAFLRKRKTYNKITLLNHIKLFSHSRKINLFFSLPGHECVLHTRCSFAAPGQDFPPFRGRGFVQLRDLPCVPALQGLLQLDQTPQPDQPPSTTQWKENMSTDKQVEATVCLTVCLSVCPSVCYVSR